MPRVKDKVAIITGGGSGIGRATALIFAKEGAKVVVADWIAEGGEKTLRMIREAGGEATFIKVDVSKTEDVKEMVKAAVDTYGKLDVLFGNAGIGKVEPLTETSEDTFEKTIAINVKGIWLGMKYAIPEMIKAGGGSIINTSSIAADACQRGFAIYGASKAAVIAMSKVAACEYGGHNIRVNVIKPGAIETPLAMVELGNNPELREKIERETPLAKIGKPEEVAQVVLFLASDESSHVTGQKLAIDGGIEADSHLK